MLLIPLAFTDTTLIFLEFSECLPFTDLLTFLLLLIHNEGLRVEVEAGEIPAGDDCLFSSFLEVHWSYQ